MKTSRIQAAFARRREAESVRMEQTAAVNRYFDHWGKVTTRFESWTTPEYYQNARESLEKQQERKEKNEKLEERREKLRTLLEGEKKSLVDELNEIRKPKPKRIATDVLQKIDSNLKHLENERRRLDLESKLYGRWRTGRTAEGSLFDAKTDHEAMAKLNWLDKQIEGHMQREKEQKEDEVRRLKLEEEARKREENLKERQKIRQCEIKDLREIQENHVHELKSREEESKRCRDEEQLYRRQNEILDNELDGIIQRKNKMKCLPKIPHNIKKIKMFIRQCSDIIRDDLKKDIELLKRLVAINTTAGDHDEQIKHFIECFEMQYDLEIQKQSQIEAMYESEAKHNLIKWQDDWSKETKLRENQILNVLDRRKSFYEDKLCANLDRQKHLMGIKETHLGAIENSNEKLKILISEEENSKALFNKSLSNMSISESGERGGRNARNDGDVAPESDRKVSSSKDINGNQPPANLPKYGRKRVAWT